MHLRIQILIALLAADQLLSYRFDFVANLTKSLSDTDSFQTFIVFRSESALTNFEGALLEEELQRSFDIPLICLSTEANDIQLRNNLNVNSLAFVVMNDLRDAIRNTSDMALSRLHHMKIIFILTKPVVAVIRVDLNELFWWCWNSNLLNVIVTFATENGTRNEVFTYMPFPDHIYIRNLENSSVTEYFWNKVADVKGYKFATPVFVDEPMVMKIHNEQRNRTYITGTAGTLYREFIRHINATFFLINISNNSLHLHQKHVVQLTTDKVIDVSIHPFTYLLPYKTDGSYPIAHTNACIILPVVPEIDRSHYIIYAFSHGMWKIILGLLVAFITIELIANYTFERRFHAGLTIQLIIAGMINQPREMSLPAPSPTSIPTSGIVRRWRTKAVVSSLVMFTGFFVSNLYVGALTSLLSTTVYGKQPESLEDILRTNLEILLLDYEMEAYFETKLFPAALRKLVRITDPDTLANHRNKLNTTYAYIVQEERWKMIDYQQSRLWKPIFKIARDFCIPNMFLSFPIQFDSPFYEVLKSFTLNVDSAGLYLRWTDKSYREAREAGVIELVKEVRVHPVMLSMEHFKLVFPSVGVCYAMCFTCLMIEMCVDAFRRFRK